MYLWHLGVVIFKSVRYIIPNLSSWIFFFLPVRRWHVAEDVYRLCVCHCFAVRAVKHNLPQCIWCQLLRMEAAKQFYDTRSIFGRTLCVAFQNKGLFLGQSCGLEWMCYDFDDAKWTNQVWIFYLHLFSFTLQTFTLKKYTNHEHCRSMQIFWVLRTSISKLQ